MTNPRPRTTGQPGQIDDKPKGVQLSPAQVTAGALASASSAVVASFFGLAGTLIGAALASVISTVSAVLYQESLERTNAKLRRVREQDTTTQVLGDGTREMSVVPAVPVARELPEHLDPRQPEPRSRPRWVKIAAYTVGIFAIAMGVITGVELIGQKLVSALVGNTETSRSTTLGAITNTSSSTEEEQQEVEQRDEEDPASPTATTPATESSSPTTSPTEEADEEPDTEETAPATPTQSSSRSSAAEPTTDTGTRTDDEPVSDEGGSSDVAPRGTSQESSQDD